MLYFRQTVLWLLPSSNKEDNELFIRPYGNRFNNNSNNNNNDND